MSLFHRRSLLWTVLVLGGGVKPGRRIPIWSHLTHLGAPFSLDSKNRFFFLREKEMGFERVSPVPKRKINPTSTQGGNNR